MRRSTDLVEDRRRVLAIAVGTALDETLQGLTHLEYRRAARATAVELRFVAESFDVIICDSGRFGAEAPRAPRELTRMLRPGGRLVANVVSLEGEQAILAWQARHGGELARIALSRSEPLGGHHAWRPLLPVTQLAATKPG